MQEIVILKQVSRTGGVSVVVGDGYDLAGRGRCDVGDAVCAPQRSINSKRSRDSEPEHG